MSERRYQVFVSSTYKDLQAERQEVIQALLELDCIPAGMELFPATDESQWNLIKQVIDDCDYYIVIIGGRYGSIGPRGISYTEMEYRYALKTNKPILAFLHENPDQIPVSKSESDSQSKKKLEEFRKFAQNKMCRFWNSPSELGGIVSRSTIRLIKHSPAIGWVKADQLPTENPVGEIIRLRKKLEVLEKMAEESVIGAKSVGLFSVINRQANYGTEDQWLQFLDSAIEKVDLMGRTLYNWTESVDAKELIVKKITEDQVTFRWLLMSESNQFLPLLEENRVNISANLINKLQAVQEFLNSIKENLSEEHQDQLEIRYYKTIPLYFSYFRIDNTFHITNYMCSANSGSSPMFQLNNVGAEWSKTYAREFETIWRISSKHEYDG